MAQDQHKVTDALFLGNLDSKVTKAVLYDICVQVGLTALCTTDVHRHLTEQLLVLCRQGLYPA